MRPWLIAYLSFTAILVLTPGATTAVVVRNTLTGGRRAGLATAVGAAIGNSSHATAAGLGLAVVFARWPVMLSTLRIVGACYLGWLGMQSAYRVLQHRDGGLRVLAESETSHAVASAGGFRQGLTVNLLNPAIAVFYLLVVPSFVPAGAPPWYFAGLAAVHIAMAIACHGLWAVALDRLKTLLHPPGMRRALEAATAVSLVYLAARVLLSA